MKATHDKHYVAKCLTHPDRFVEDFYGCHLHWYQRLMLRMYSPRQKRRTYMQDRKKRKWHRQECGVCGMIQNKSHMVQDSCSPTGWLCHACYIEVRPEYLHPEYFTKG